MSRTFRRNKQHQILHWIGSFEEFIADEMLWTLYRDAYRGTTEGFDNFFSEESQKKFLDEYLTKVTDYTRDRRSGCYGVPRWFRNEFTREERHQQRSEIHRCLKNDEWDDFLVIKNPDAAAWYWF